MQACDSVQGTKEPMAQKESFAQRWKEIIRTKKPMRMGHLYKYDGVKDKVMCILRLYKGEPQIHVRYGKVWYKFKLTDITDQYERDRIVAMNIRE